MRKIQILLAALVAVVMSSCTFKTEATVDVEVVAGVAHFDLKSPDDFAPSSVGAQDEETFYFAVFDASEELLGYVFQKVKTGDKLTVKLSLDEQPD